jgi:hypothetical protein
MGEDKEDGLIDQLPNGHSFAAPAVKARRESTVGRSANRFCPVADLVFGSAYCSSIVPIEKTRLGQPSNTLRDGVSARTDNGLPIELHDLLDGTEIAASAISASQAGEATGVATASIARLGARLFAFWGRKGS